MKTPRLQNKSGLADEIAAIIADLDRLVPTTGTPNFPNQRDGFEHMPAPLAGLARQAVARRAAAVVSGTSAGVPLLSGITPPSPPITTTPKPRAASASVAVKTSGAGSISSRALSSLAKRRAPAPAPTKKRHTVEDKQVGGWWNALPAGEDRWWLSLRLSPDIERQALRKPEPLDWLRERINRALKPVLGAAPIGFYCAGTRSKGGNMLHVHAILTFPAGMKSAVERALAVILGHDPADKSIKAKIHVKRARTSGVAVYMMGNAAEAKQDGLHGKLMVASGQLKSAATKAYEEQRQERKAKKSSNVRTDSSVNIDLSQADTSEACDLVLAADSQMNQNKGTTNQPEAFAHDPRHLPHRRAVRRPGRPARGRTTDPPARPVPRAARLDRDRDHRERHLARLH